MIRVESGTETPLEIGIVGSDTLSQQAMVVIRGMPDSVSLTAGRLFPSGVWAIKASAARSVKFVTASHSYEDTPLIVSLVTLDGAYLSNATTQLVVAPVGLTASVTNATRQDNGGAQSVAAHIAPITPNAEIEAAPQNTSPRPVPADKDNVRVLNPEDIEKILKLMRRGDQHLLEGKIPSARRFYQLATEMGWPEGALAIARTYDADHLRRFPILGGIAPDEVLARDWYRRARELSLRVQMRDRQFSGQQ
jgi:hypothetical protein